MFVCMEDVLKLFSDNYNFIIVKQRLAAIWDLKNTAYVLEDGALKMTRKFTAGQKVRIVDGEITDCDIGNVTHEILSCHGTEHDFHEIEIKNLQNGDTSTVPFKIKSK